MQLKKIKSIEDHFHKIIQNKNHDKSIRIEKLYHAHVDEIHILKTSYIDSIRHLMTYNQKLILDDVHSRIIGLINEHNQIIESIKIYATSNQFRFNKAKIDLIDNEARIIALSNYEMNTLVPYLISKFEENDAKANAKKD